jgi:methionyl-tRNA synthetase
MNHYLKPNSPTELHHFIGKDISYFHTLFWPAVLHGSGFRRPTAVHVHGFLTINGQKMSKSRGTFITARRYLEHLPPEPLRYYFCAKLGPGVDDIDLSLEDFTARVNSDLVGKLVNIASRCAGFVSRAGGRLATSLPEPELHAEFAAAAPRIAALYEARDYSQAMREIMQLADRANQYVDARKPWALARDPAQAETALAVATQGINLFRVLVLYLAPVLPQMACKAAAFLGTPLARWSEAGVPLLGTELAAYEPLATRLELKAVAALVAPPAAPAAGAATSTTGNEPTVSVEPAFIGIDDFTKVQLRIAEVLAASTVEGSDKLLKLTLGVGDSQRTVFSGIRKSYSPESLIGKRVVLVANLAPRKMRFGVSEGMVLCATDDDDRVYLLTADDGAAGGMPIS